MTLIKSISGIRGTIGGKPGDNLTPVDVVECTAGYATVLLKKTQRPKVVVGRDARMSGSWVQSLVISTLTAQGLDVIDLGLSTTPTVELMVTWENADGGIILTASHNPKEWNALKFLNAQGEFISSDTGREILNIIDNKGFTFQSIDQTGNVLVQDNAIERHIAHCLELDHVDAPKIRSKSFRVAVDAINSTGNISMVPLLQELGCSVVVINSTMHGDFAHNPEPLPKHLTELSEAVVNNQCDLGVAVDPDVDRLAFVAEDGSFFGEEYTIVALADHILSHEPKGNTVSNLSSTRALSDVTTNHGGSYFASAVGEVNVVSKMKEVGAVFGGEGNGGVIYPRSHYGRDALVGVALFLTMMAERSKTAREIRTSLPEYYIAKHKITLESTENPQAILDRLKVKFSKEETNEIDGLKVLFDKEWVHIRRSNTEPILRIYAESLTEEKADALARKFVEHIKEVKNR